MLVPNSIEKKKSFVLVGHIWPATTCEDDNHDFFSSQFPFLPGSFISTFFLISLYITHTLLVILSVYLAVSSAGIIFFLYLSTDLS
jgi:hypothetical protein